MQLTTTAKVKSFLGLSGATYDTLISDLIDGVSAFVETYCNRTFGSASITEYYDGGISQIVVKQRPIKDDVQVVVSYNNGTQANPSWEAIHEDDLSVNFNAGVISFGYGLPSGFNNIKVVYTGGNASVPNDIELVAKELTARVFEQRKAQGKNKESISGVSVDWSRELTEMQKLILDKNTNIVV